MFTRFHDDPYRIQKQLEESSYAGKYQINAPGPGLHLPYIEDSQIRMQTWGANLTTNSRNVESDLFGLTRPLNRDLEEYSYKNHEAFFETKPYTTMQPFVEESRASHPAWTYKELEHPRWETPFINPQSNLEKGFYENIQTRILEKDFFVPKIPMVKLPNT